MNSRLIDTVDGLKAVKVNGSLLPEQGIQATVEELPLEFVMIVRNPKIASDKFINGENNKILIAGYGKQKENIQRPE